MSNCIGPLNINSNDNQIILQDVNNSITIVDNNCCSNVEVTQPLTEVVVINAPGPQGPRGENGAGIDTGSFATTGSNIFYGDQIINGNLTVTGSILGTASWAISSSYALTASYALNSPNINTGSFVTTSSFNLFTGSYNTGSFTGSFTGSLLGSASYARSSSRSLTSISSSYSLSTLAAGVNGSVQVNAGGLLYADSYFNYDWNNERIGLGSSVPLLMGYSNVYSDNEAGLYNDSDGALAVYSPDIQSFIYGAGLYRVNLNDLTNNFYGPVILNNGATGSLHGTASWAENTISASYIQAYGQENTIQFKSGSTLFSTPSMSYTSDGNFGSYLKLANNPLFNSISLTLKSIDNRGSGVAIGGGIDSSTESGIYAYDGGTSLVHLATYDETNDTFQLFGGSFVSYHDHDPSGSMINLRAFLSGDFNVQYGNLTLSNNYFISASTIYGNLTGSVYGTASWAERAISSSYVLSSSYSTTSSYVLSSSYSVSSSYVLSSSYALSSSFASSASRAITSSNSITSSYVTGSIFNQNNLALSASYALTASYALSSSNTINAQTSSYLPVGTYQITSSWSVSSSQAQTASFAISASYAKIFPYTGSAIISGSLSVIGSITSSFISSSNITGSLFGTASWAISSSKAISSSYALFATNASVSTLSTNADNILVTLPDNTNALKRYITFAEPTGSYDNMKVHPSLTYDLNNGNPILDYKFSGAVTTFNLGISDATISRGGILNISGSIKGFISGSSGGDKVLILSGSTGPLMYVRDPYNNSGSIFEVISNSHGSPLTSLKVNSEGYVYTPQIPSSFEQNLITYNSSTGKLSYYTASAFGGGGGSTFPYTGTAVITGSLIVSGSITGSLFGTASYALSSGTVVTQSFTGLSTWVFNHNLGRRELVIETFDSSYNQIIPQQLTLTDENNTTITFPSPIDGFAVATFGGTGAQTQNNYAYELSIPATTGLSSGTLNQIQYDAETLNIGSAFSYLGSTITCLKAGVYNIYVSCLIDLGHRFDDSVVIQLTQNGSVSSSKTKYFAYSSIRYFTPDLTCVLNLEVGDTITVDTQVQSNNYKIIDLDPILNQLTSYISITQ